MLDASPRYAFSPLAPYRIKMVRPGAKFVFVVRDPTDRYFSQLRMDFCRGKPGKGFPSVDAMVTARYHHNGGAKAYLAMAEVAYQPYTPLCRGENASSSDLWKCYKALDVYDPLYRGLYADQLERWFRVFDRFQTMVIDWSELLEDFTGVTTAVAKFAGLPQHSFKYDPSNEHKTGCSIRDHAIGNDFFAEGGRYDMMVDEEELFREWYRPHNERLYKLLDRNLMWR
eukprot:jgi/Undpi1/10307/HiC_scaffold_28.g12758.m1